MRSATKKYIKCYTGYAGHFNKVSHFTSCIVAAMLSNRIVMPDDRGYLSRLYAFPTDLMAFAQFDPALPAPGLSFIHKDDWWLKSNLTSLFGDHQVVFVRHISRFS